MFDFLQFENEMRAKLLRSCLTLCDPMDRSFPTRLLYPWNSPGKNAAVGCHFLLQAIFQPRGGTQVSYVSCIGRWVLYHQHHLGSPQLLGIGKAIVRTLEEHWHHVIILSHGIVIQPTWQGITRAPNISLSCDPYYRAASLVSPVGDQLLPVCLGCSWILALKVSC